MEKNNLEVIRKYHDSEIGCAEAMVLGVHNIVGKEVDATLLQDTLKLSDVFRKGIAGLQQTCGYITGFAMALSLYLDIDSEAYQDKMRAFALYQEELYGSNQCCEIVEDFEIFASPERKMYCTKMLEALLEKSEEILKDI